MGKIINKVAIILSLCFLMIGCGPTYSESNEYIQYVKDSTYGTHKNMTCGEAFDNFFENPKWRFFYSDTNENVVEFTGKCLYDNVEVEVLMQITVDMEAGKRSVNYLSFNDVPQNQLMIDALMEAVYRE